MRNGAKTTKTLKLEQDSLEEILNPKNIIKRSKESLGMSGAMTVSEAMPRLSVIAKEKGKNLNNPDHFKECVEIMNNERL